VSQRLQEIYEEVGKLAENDEDPNDWVGFVNPQTFVEFRHPSSDARMIDGSILSLSGLELRPNELVEVGAIVLIKREMIADDPPPASQEAAS
jgi:hypothetical protein